MSSNIVERHRCSDKITGMVTYKLSPSLWTAAFRMPMIYSNSGVHWPIFVTPVLLALALTVFVQLMFMWYVKDLDHDDRCSESPTLLAYLCVGALTLYVFATEVKQSVTMISWIRKVPVQKKSCSTADDVKFKLVVDVQGPGERLWMPDFGMSHFYRAFSLLIFVVGRVAVSVLVTWYGAGLILETDDKVEQIFNAVAVIFILELDNNLYIVTVPELIKKELDAIPPIDEYLFGDVDELDNHNLLELRQFGCHHPLASSTCGALRIHLSQHCASASLQGSM